MTPIESIALCVLVFVGAPILCVLFLVTWALVRALLPWVWGSIVFLSCICAGILAEIIFGED